MLGGIYRNQEENPGGRPRIHPRIGSIENQSGDCNFNPSQQFPHLRLYEQWPRRTQEEGFLAWLKSAGGSDHGN